MKFDTDLRRSVGVTVGWTAPFESSDIENILLVSSIGWISWNNTFFFRFQFLPHNNGCHSLPGIRALEFKFFFFSV